jgi:hypothetical protein
MARTYGAEAVLVDKRSRKRDSWNREALNEKLDNRLLSWITSKKTVLLDLEEKRQWVEKER